MPACPVAERPAHGRKRENVICPAMAVYSVQSAVVADATPQGEVVAHLTALIFIINGQLTGDMHGETGSGRHINGIKRHPVTLFDPVGGFRHAAGNGFPSAACPASPVMVAEMPFTLFCVVYCPGSSLLPPHRQPTGQRWWAGRWRRWTYVRRQCTGSRFHPRSSRYRHWCRYPV